MLISMNLIFSWLSDFQPFCAPELDTSIRLSSVKLLYEYEKEVSPEVLYVCTFEELTQFLRTHDLQKISLISVLCLAERIEELKSLPKGINWIWISGSFHRSMIYNTLYDLFYTLRQWDNRLVEIILDEQGLQAMLDISEEIIPYYTLIWDAMFIIHAHSTHIPLESKALYKEIEQGYLSKEQVDQIIQRKLAANSDFISTRYIPGEQLFSGTGGLFHNVFHNGARFFTIGIYTDTENVPPHTLELVEHFLKRIESYLLHNVDAWQNSPFPYETFLVDILDDRLSNPEIIKQKAAFYQVDSEINYRLYCIELEEYDTTISRYLIKNMLQGSNAMRSILYKDSIVILRVVNDNPMLEEDAVQSWTQNLHNILKIYDFRCGASAIFQGLCHVRWAYKEARSALQLGKRLSDSEERIFCHDDYYAYHILDSIADTEAVEGFVLKSLFSLIEDDLKRNNNGTRLLETYLNANLSITDTARLLSMHRNSVHYRIRRLEEMLGIDFSNHNAVIQVDMSIKILRYLIYVKKKYREYQPLFPIQGPFDSQ